MIIDLHGGVGSQNGFDNSGHNGTVGFGTGSTVDDTLAVVQLIANKYAQKQYQDVVVGIELLNEPMAANVSGGPDTVVQFVNDGFGDVRSISDTPVVIHDGFQPGTFWNGVLVPPKAQDVIVDHHEYQVFTQEFIDMSAEVSIRPHTSS